MILLIIIMSLCMFLIGFIFSYLYFVKEREYSKMQIITLSDKEKKILKK